MSDLYFLPHDARALHLHARRAAGLAVPRLQDRHVAVDGDVHSLPERSDHDHGGRNMTPLSDTTAAASRRPEPAFYGPLEFLHDRELREVWDTHDRRNEHADLTPGTGFPDDNLVRFPPQLRLVANEATTKKSGAQGWNPGRRTSQPTQEQPLMSNHMMPPPTNITKASADDACAVMTDDMQTLLVAAVDTLLQQHPVLLVHWSGNGFPLTRGEFAGLFLEKLADSTRMQVNAEARRMGLAA
jgi:hypothetical protein